MTYAEALRHFRACRRTTDGLALELRERREAVTLASSPYAYSQARTLLSQVEAEHARWADATKEARRVMANLRDGLSAAG